MNKSLSTLQRLLAILLLITFVISPSKGADTLSTKNVKRYIRPCIYFNHYVTPDRRRLQKNDYSFRQSNIGFYLPLYTTQWTNKKDSLRISTLHLLGVADIMRYNASVNFLRESYQIARLSAGLRLFYSDGKKSVFFFGISPFFAQDFTLFGKSPIRTFSAFVYSRTVSEKFAYRIGFVRSLSFGRAFTFPIVGMRIGALDKVHLTIQIPRNISLNFPIGKSTIGSVFSRSMGGVYNVTANDTLITNTDALLRFRRYELLNGFQFNFRTGKNFSFYIATGFVTRRTIRYSFEENPSTSTLINTQRYQIPSSIFINFGLSIRLGQAKRVYNNRLVYDVMDMNTLNTIGMKNAGVNDNGVPIDSKKYKLEKATKLKYKDVQDLILEEY